MKFFKVLGGVLAVGAVVIGGVLLYDASTDHPYTVSYIVDGDTLDVEHRGDTIRVRLLNVDTPELARFGNPTECMAEEATAFLEELLPIGTEVELQYDEERTDRYDRTLGAVFKDDVFVNAEIAAAGLGTALVVGENDRFYPEVADAVAQAEAEGLGIHGVDENCTPL